MEDTEQEKIILQKGKFRYFVGETEENEMKKRKAINIHLSNIKDICKRGIIANQEQQVLYQKLAAKDAELSGISLELCAEILKLEKIDYHEAYTMYQSILNKSGDKLIYGTAFKALLDILKIKFY